MSSLCEGGDAMNMRLKFPPVLEKPEDNEQPTKSEEREAPCLCPLCLRPVDLNDDYETVIVVVSGRRFFYHLFPCLAGPKEYEV